MVCMTDALPLKGLISCKIRANYFIFFSDRWLIIFKVIFNKSAVVSYRKAQERNASKSLECFEH